MTERPILFSGPMVRAILDGRKAQTRRVVKMKEGIGPANAKYRPGDRLWVRETIYNGDDNKWRRKADDSLIELAANDERVSYMIAWAHHQERDTVPSIFMPRFASRLTLEIVNVRVERLQEISEEDALAEGVSSQIKHSAAFADLWDSINAKRGFGWDVNPWVWVIEFKPLPPQAGAKG